MQTGYSILLGEFIEAKAISHRDCEPFQIVCPACHEPLFKVQRPGDDYPIEYLSHYRQSENYDSSCALRVFSTTTDQKNHHNSESREQKLSFFLSVFTSALEKDPLVSYSRGFSDTHRQINRSKAWRYFRNRHLESARAGGVGDKEQFQLFADFYIEEGFAKHGIPKTGFSTNTQIRIASDLMQLLLSAPGKPNYEALFNHSAIYLVSRFSVPPVDGTPESAAVSKNLVRFVTSLIQSGERAGMETLAEMASTPIYPPFVERPSSYILKVASEIAHEMIGTLLRLPYFTLLKNRSDK
jgi:hypothetical protein